jgi:hypothetical protein
MFEIKIADADVTSGTIPVSWCVDLETIKKLSDDKVVDPQVVIVVAPEGSAYSQEKEYRKVVPLKDLLAYVEFRVPGKNKIWAFISSKKDARDAYLGKSSGRYITTIISSDGERWGYMFDTDAEGNRRPAMGSETISVSVPEGVFAPEPAQWEKDWVNHFFRNKCVDQCEFRKRRMIAYTGQVLLMLGQLVLRSLFLLVALLIGAKNVSLQPLLHPLQYDMGEAASVCGGGTIFVRKVPEDSDSEWIFGKTFWSSVSYVVRKFWTLPLMPAILIPVTLLILAHKVLIFSGVLLALILIAFAILFFVTGGARAAWEWIKGAESETLWYMDQAELDMLTCNPDRKAFTFKSLPSKKQTLRLRFSDLKSKVCRPFSA